MTQATNTAPAQTFSSPIGAAEAASPPPALPDARSANPHWTAYAGLLISLITAIGGGFLGYQVHNAHIDDNSAQHAETLKDHETRIRANEQLPARMTGMEQRLTGVEKQVDKFDDKLDKILARPSH